jgi:hypothetical protein
VRDGNSKTLLPRLLTIALLVAAVLSLGVVAAGCGGGGSDEKKGEHADAEQPNGEDEGGEEGEHGQAQALSKIPPADRAAFFGLATAIGALRVRAAPVAVGSSSHLSSAAPLRTASRQVAAFHPEDHQLQGIRAQLVPLLRRFARAPTSGPAARRAARAALADADRIEAGLRSYTKRIPAIGGAIPD